MQGLRRCNRNRRTKSDYFVHKSKVMDCICRLNTIRIAKNHTHLLIFTRLNYNSKHTQGISHALIVFLDVQSLQTSFSVSTRYPDVSNKKD